MSTSTAHDVRRLAVESVTDPRTVRRFLEGKPLREMTRIRLEQAAARIGVSVAPVAVAAPKKRRGQP